MTRLFRVNYDDVYNNKKYLSIKESLDIIWSLIKEDFDDICLMTYE